MARQPFAGVLVPSAEPLHSSGEPMQDALSRLPLPPEPGRRRAAIFGTPAKPIRGRRRAQACSTGLIALGVTRRCLMPGSGACSPPPPVTEE